MPHHFQTIEVMVYQSILILLRRLYKSVSH